MNTFPNLEENFLLNDSFRERELNENSMDR